MMINIKNIHETIKNSIEAIEAKFRKHFSPEACFIFEF